MFCGVEVGTGGGGAWRSLRHLPARPSRAWPGGMPSEIPSQTRSVSAFLPGQAPAGPRASGDLHSSQAPPLLAATRGTHCLCIFVRKHFDGRRITSLALSCAAVEVVENLSWDRAETHSGWLKYLNPLWILISEARLSLSLFSDHLLGSAIEEIVYRPFGPID